MQKQVIFHLLFITAPLSITLQAADPLSPVDSESGYDSPSINTPEYRAAQAVLKLIRSLRYDDQDPAIRIMQKNDTIFAAIEKYREAEKKREEAKRKEKEEERLQHRSPDLLEEESPHSQPKTDPVPSSVAQSPGNRKECCGIIFPNAIKFYRHCAQNVKCKKKHGIRKYNKLTSSDNSHTNHVVSSKLRPRITRHA